MPIVLLAFIYSKYLTFFNISAELEMARQVMDASNYLEILSYDPDSPHDTVEQVEKLMTKLDKHRSAYERLRRARLIFISPWKRNFYVKNLEQMGHKKCLEKIISMEIL